MSLGRLAVPGAGPGPLPLSSQFRDIGGKQRYISYEELLAQLTKATSKCCLPEVHTRTVPKTKSHLSQPRAHKRMKGPALMQGACSSSDPRTTPPGPRPPAAALLLSPFPDTPPCTLSFRDPSPAGGPGAFSCERGKFIRGRGAGVPHIHRTGAGVPPPPHLSHLRAAGSAMTGVPISGGFSLQGAAVRDPGVWCMLFVCCECVLLAVAIRCFTMRLPALTFWRFRFRRFQCHLVLQRVRVGVCVLPIRGILGLQRDWFSFPFLTLSTGVARTGKCREWLVCNLEG